MSVPKKRKTNARTKRGRSHDALKTKVLAKCKKCGQPTMPHQVCPACGSYKGKEVVKPKTKKKKEKKG